MRRLQAPLLGGLFIGVLSALPIVGYCCCLWVVTGGLLTTWLKHQAGERLEGTDVALAGLTAGVVGAVISLLLTALMFAFSGDMIEEQMRVIVEQYPQLPPEVRDRMLSVTTGPALILLMSLVTVPVYAVFGMGGALVGLLFFREPQAPATPA
jgi:hypothetical protein